jgi:outer membrane receptor protein involved in Fe transport
VLYGLRGDVVQLNYSDPLGGADYGAPPGLPTLPQSASTNWYGLYNGNISVVYSPTSHVSTYATYNKAQYTLPTANDGAIATWGEDPTWQLRQNTLLEELGVKLDMLDKALFLSSAIFRQERTITTGEGGLAHTLAHIKGAEVELNYQPDPHFFATASYSYLHTTLDSPATFYNFPATPGINYDGAGASATNPFLPNQTFNDPGVPQHLFNVLGNYKHESAGVLRQTFRSRDPSKPHNPAISTWRPFSRLTRASRHPKLHPTQPTAGTTSRPRFPGSTL